MPFEPEKIRDVEKSLGDLVRGTTGVRHIRGCSDPDLGCYRISFGYQRKKPLKDYLLIYDPDERTIVMCADGGIGTPPPNVRQRLLKRFAGKGYNESIWAYSWSNIDLEGRSEY